MNWFRSRIRSGAQLALFALAVQMVLSFGHMHRDDLGLPPLPTSNRLQGASVAMHIRGHRDNPAPGPTHDDYCPICASMALIATAMPSLPPVLILPEPIRRLWPTQMPVRGVSLKVALSFQARAPPAA